MDTICDNTEINWADYTPAKLKTPISSVLSNTISSQNRSRFDPTTNMHDDEISSDSNLESKTLK